MIHIPGRIPITIHPLFWVTAGLIGFFNSMSLIGTLVWIVIIFVSVLVHEFGHALTSLLFKQSPRIELVALGGLTYHGGEKLPTWKQFFIVFNGPLFGFFLFLIASAVLLHPAMQQGFVGAVIMTFQAVNLYWTILNLIPVMPLDGGHLLRVVLEGFFGARGNKYALFISMIVAALMSLVFFALQAFLVGALLFLFAFQSYDSWRRMRVYSEKDQSDSLKTALEKAEIALQAGRKEEALQIFEQIRSDAKEGMIYTTATQYLAYLKYDMGKPQESYDLLRSIRSELSSDALVLLHRAAFDQKDYPLVVELSGQCFQAWPSADLALRNAYACASLAQAEPAVGWLETAQREGVQNLDEVLTEKCFDIIRQDPSFRNFLESLKKHE